MGGAAPTRTGLCLRIEDRIPAAHVGQHEVVLPLLVTQVQRCALAGMAALHEGGRRTESDSDTLS